MVLRLKLDKREWVRADGSGWRREGPITSFRVITPIRTIFVQNNKYLQQMPSKYLLQEWTEENRGPGNAEKWLKLEKLKK